MVRRRSRGMRDALHPVLRNIELECSQSTVKRCEQVDWRAVGAGRDCVTHSRNAAPCHIDMRLVVAICRCVDAQAAIEGKHGRHAGNNEFDQCWFQFHVGKLRRKTCIKTWTSSLFLDNVLAMEGPISAPKSLKSRRQWFVDTVRNRPH